MERCLPLFSGSSSVLRQQRPALLAVPRSPLRPQRVRPSSSPLAISIPLPLGNPQSSSSRVAVPSTAPEEVSRLTTVHSPEELNTILEQNKDKLVVLMCKAKGCRPCKLFMRKYRGAAAVFSDAIFLEIFGDESKDTRALMISMAVKVTPTFVLYRGGEKVHSHGGVNEGNLYKAIKQQLLSSEAGAGFQYADEGEQTDEE